MLKKICHKLLFIIPLIGLILSYVNGINSSLIEQDKKTTIVQSEKNNLRALSFYHEIENRNDDSEFFFEESELENEIELDWLFANNKSEIFTSSITENQKLYNKNSFCLQQKNKPLYDLFCNWKHHLS